MKLTKATSTPRLHLSKTKTIELLAFAKPFHRGDPDAPNSFALIGFRDRDGNEQIAAVPASHLVTRLDRLIGLLSDRGYAWPDPRSPRKVIDELGRSQAPHQVIISFVPGWHGNMYVRPDETFHVAGTAREEIFFVRHGSVKLAPFLRKGSLKRWKRLVASVGTHSSRARLFIGLPFAAAVLGRINGKSFGVVLVGGSSTAKTLCLRLASSVPGHNGPEGPLTLKASAAAIEEVFLGHRDGFAGLDEVGLAEGGDSEVASFFKALSFQTSTGQSKNRAASYERSVNALKPDTRIIIGLTSEVSLGAIAERANRQRLRGEELRLIELRAEPDGQTDIFDGKRAAEKIGKTFRQRGKKIEGIEDACNSNQGVAHCKFLERFCADPDAVRRMTKWRAAFETRAKDLPTDPSTRRIVSSFGIVYAAVRLAIFYEILPWKPVATMLAILVCLRDALRDLPSAEGKSHVAESLRNEATLLADFAKRVRFCDKVRLGAGANVDKKRMEAAEGLVRGDRELLLKSAVLHGWYPNPLERRALVGELQGRHIMSAGRSPDTNTVQVKIAAMSPRRQPYYRLDTAKLGLPDELG